MSTEKTDAVVIRLTDFSETSQVASLFTRDFGRISVLAKGAKRLNSRFESALDLLSECRIVFIRKSSSNLDILTEAGLLCRFRPAGRDMMSLYGGYYVAELLAGLTEEYDPHPGLFDIATETLGALSKPRSCAGQIVRFELAILREIGNLPNLESCPGCSCPLSSGGPFVFRVSQGGLFCSRCFSHHNERRPVHAGTIRLMQALADPEREFPERLTIQTSQLQEMRFTMTAAISNCLGRRPRMLRYIDAGTPPS